MSLTRALFACLLFVGCATVPGTGRSQLLLISDADANALGVQSFAAMTSEAQIVQGGKQAQMVQRIGKRIVAAAQRRFPRASAGLDWEFVLIQENVANAWALPGGKSAVYTGLLPVTQDEASLAIVMGHEVGHVIAKHGAERMSQQLVAEGGLSVAQLLSDGGDHQAEVMGALGLATQGVVLKYSRDHESEADQLGLELAADAGYDPRVAVGLWQRMGALGGERPPEWLSTHPSEETRISRLERLMPGAMQIYKAAQAAGR